MGYTAIHHQGLEETYGRARIKATWTMPRKSGILPLVNEVEFAGKGNTLLRTVHVPRQRDPTDNNLYATRAALVANPKLSFRLVPPTEPSVENPSEW